MIEETNTREAKNKLQNANSIYKERQIDEILKLADLLIKHTISAVEFSDKVRKIIRV